MPGDARQRIGDSTLIDLDAQVPRRQVDGLLHGQGEGRPAEFHRADAEQQVMHDRVAYDRQAEDVPQVDARLCSGAGHKLVDGPAHLAGHFSAAFGVHHGVRDPAHQILAEADLRIHHAVRAEHVAAAEVAEMGSNGGRSDVDRHTVDELLEAGPQSEDFRILVHGDRHRPLAGAQQVLEVRQQRGRESRAQIPLRLHSVEESRLVAAGAEIRRRHVHKVETNHWIQADRPGVGVLAYDLAVHLAFRWHVDQEVALDGGLATQPVARRERLAAFAVAGLDGPGRRQVLRAGNDAVLGEVAYAADDAAAPAEPAATTDGGDVHAECPRRFEHRCAECELAAVAGRREDHPCLASGLTFHADA